MTANMTTAAIIVTLAVVLILGSVGVMITIPQKAEACKPGTTCPEHPDCHNILPNGNLRGACR